MRPSTLYRSLSQNVIWVLRSFTLTIEVEDWEFVTVLHSVVVVV